MSKRIFYPLLALIIPLFGMFFSDQFNWSVFDFFVMGSFLFLLGVVINFISTKVKNKKFRYILFTIILILFALTYVELAVGVLGSPFAGQ